MKGQEPLEDVWRASKVAITRIGHTGGLMGVRA
jgi:hypothetical protein